MNQRATEYIAIESALIFEIDKYSDFSCKKGSFGLQIIVWHNKGDRGDMDTFTFIDQ